MDGVYRVQLYGASGGGNHSGAGGFAKGDIQLKAGQTLYVYIGGVSRNGYGGWNGGGSLETPSWYGSGAGGGGGASDVRINTSISGRIMVAGGGGGCDDDSALDGFGGYGGGLAGQNGLGSSGGAAGTQNSGYALGQGGMGCKHDAGGGGGGYYGGRGGGSVNAGGGGGSSYVSGMPGCSVHYSGMKFTNGGTTAGCRRGDGFGQILLIRRT